MAEKKRPSGRLGNREDRGGGKPGNEEHKLPAAGPHAKPELTNPDATPGTGSLPDPGEPNADSTSG
ncbi:hypothetical protein AB4072_11500 [Microvirga sp. 2MCAF38]|uniref:hypothetical protein n=1 Tax=Microvirga sp. 2MCAF38 TaxID=3232989 RepID=UPI003F974B5F